LGLTKPSTCRYRNTQKLVRGKYLKLLTQQIHLGPGFLPFALTNSLHAKPDHGRVKESREEEQPAWSKTRRYISLKMELLASDQK
jgi:hypothetical protein